jgi:VanZ family protein
VHKPNLRLQRYFFSPRARRVWTVLLVLLAIFTFAKAVSPRSPSLLTFGWDKADHLTAFSVLAWVGVIAWHGRPRLRWPLALGLFAFGGLIELAQLFVPGRSSDWVDLLADTLGIALGLALGTGLAARLERRKRAR